VNLKKIKIKKKKGGTTWNTMNIPERKKEKERKGKEKKEKERKKKEKERKRKERKRKLKRKTAFAVKEEGKQVELGRYTFSIGHSYHFKRNKLLINA
jgi:uncharacterized Rmd1/YagE family protein